MTSRNQKRAAGEQVHSVTSANEAASIEAKQRMRSYAIKMGLRVVFFVAGAIIAVTWNKWIGLILMGVSAVLPWFAVMGANLIRPPEQVMGAEYAKAKRQEELHAEPRHEKDGSSRGSVTIEGELAEDEESKGKDEDS